MRLAAVLVIAAALAFVIWRLEPAWWAWVIYGLLVGMLLTFAERGHEGDHR